MKARIRIYAALLTGLPLIPGLFLQADSSVPSIGSSNVTPSHPAVSSGADADMAMTNAIVRPAQTAIKLAQELAVGVKDEIANRPKKPSTSGMSKEWAAKQQAEYNKMLVTWRLALTSLQRNILAVQKKMQYAEKNLRRLQRSALSAAKRKDRQDQQRALLREKGPQRTLRPRRPTTGAGNRKPVLVVAKVRKTLILLRKQRQETARLLRRIGGVLRPRPERKSPAGSAAQTPALRGSGTPPAQ